MRIVVMATGDIAIPSFKRLIEGGDVVALYTQPDRPVGRHQVLTPPRVKQIAIEAGIPTYQPERMRDTASVEQLRALQADIIVVFAYGQILSQEVIDCARIACINAHASLLPRHRGASCIQAAIEAGDEQAGMTIMHVVKKLDAGDIICQKAIELKGYETAESLHDKFAELTPDLLIWAIVRLVEGTAEREAQNENLSTYAPKLLRSHGAIDWEQPAFQVSRKIRAYHSWPGTFTTYIDAKTQTQKVLKIFPPIDYYSRYEKGADSEAGEILEASSDGLIVSCGGEHGGAVRIVTLQPPGGRKMGIESFFAGHKLPLGLVLGKELPEPSEQDEDNKEEA